MGPLNLYMHIKNIYHYKLEQNWPVTWVCNIKLCKNDTYWFILASLHHFSILQYTKPILFYDVRWIYIHIL